MSEAEAMARLQRPVEASDAANANDDANDIVDEDDDGHAAQEGSPCWITKEEKDAEDDDDG